MKEYELEESKINYIKSISQLLNNKETAALKTANKLNKNKKREEIDIIIIF